MRLTSDNTEIMINDKTDGVIENFFDSVLSRYQIGLETSVISRDSIFDCVHLLYYECHKINFKQVGLYIDFCDWKKETKKQQYIPSSDVTLLFEHLPSRASEIERFQIFSCLRENKLAQRFSVKFNLLLFFLIS